MNMQEIVLKPNLGRTLINFIPFSLILLFLSLILLFFNIILGSLVISIIILGTIYFIGVDVSRKYVLKEKSIEENFIFFSKSTKTIPYKQITDISSNKTWILDSIFSTGSLFISTSGSEGADFRFSYIKNHQEIYNELSQRLNYSKSIEIQENGEILGSHQNMRENKLENRVKPSAGIAVIMHMIPTACLWIYAVKFFFFIPTLIQLIFIYFSFKKMYFDFYSDKIDYYDGFLNKNKKSLSYERITDIIETRNLFDRIFGVSKISVQTAGSSTPAIMIRYVKNGEKIVLSLKEVLKKHGIN